MFWIFLIITLTGLDILIKSLAQQYFTIPVEIIPGFLQFAVSYNPGIAFSIPIPNIIMIIVTPLILCAVIFFTWQHIDVQHPLSRFCAALFLAGGFGNLANRIFEGSVVDFIDFSFWPSFNLADSYLTIAALLIIIFHGKILIRI